MKVIEIKHIPESRCNYCNYLTSHVEVVEILPAGQGEPRELGWRCPECRRLDSFTEVEEKEGITT